MPADDIPNGPVDPARKRGYDAVYAVIQRWPGEAERNAVIWRAVMAYEAAVGAEAELTDMAQAAATLVKLARNRADRFEAAIERVRAEHRPIPCCNACHDGGEGQHCAVCEYDDPSGNIWPCPTIRALDTPSGAESHADARTGLNVAREPHQTPQGAQEAAE